MTFLSLQSELCQQLYVEEDCSSRNVKNEHLLDHKSIEEIHLNDFDKSAGLCIKALYRLSNQKQPIFVSGDVNNNKGELEKWLTMSDEDLFCRGQNFDISETFPADISEFRPLRKGYKTMSK